MSKPSLQNKKNTNTLTQATETTIEAMLYKYYLEKKVAYFGSSNLYCHSMQFHLFFAPQPFQTFTPQSTDERHLFVKNNSEFHATLHTSELIASLKN